MILIVTFLSCNALFAVENAKIWNKVTEQKTYEFRGKKITKASIQKIREHLIAILKQLDEVMKEIEQDDNISPNESDIHNEIKEIANTFVQNLPVFGNKDARFTIIEYTELWCPYCYKQARTRTIQNVLTLFNGQINAVSRPFIIHGEDVMELSNAMECVAHVDDFYYREILNEAFDEYPISLESLQKKIKSYIMERQKNQSIQTCIDQGTYKKEIQDNMKQATEIFGVNGTPATIIIDRETWKWEKVEGAYPLENFIEAVEKLGGVINPFGEIEEWRPYQYLETISRKDHTVDIYVGSGKLPYIGGSEGDGEFKTVYGYIYTYPDLNIQIISDTPQHAAETHSYLFEKNPDWLYLSWNSFYTDLFNQEKNLEVIRIEDKSPTMNLNEMRESCKEENCFLWWKLRESKDYNKIYWIFWPAWWWGLLTPIQEVIAL